LNLLTEGSKPRNANWITSRLRRSAMIRFLFRFLGLWMIAGAFVFFVYDGTKSIADRMLYFTKVSEFWAWVHQDSLLALQPAIERHFAWLWDPVVVTVLAAPASLVL
jgi:hypothetical protein